MKRYFIGITGISTAGKSSLAAALLSDHISPKIFPIPHTTRRPARPDDDPRVLRCINVEEFARSSFLTVDQNYGTLLSDYEQFLASGHSIAVSVISCNEVPDLLERLPSADVTPVFISLTLTGSLDRERKAIEKRLPEYFPEELLHGRIQRDLALAENYFFNEKYLTSNGVISFSQELGATLAWIDKLRNYVPISYNQYLQRDIEAIQSIRK